MLVIADSSPINVLVRIGCVDVLPALFRQVLIPTEVAEELSHPKTPQEVKDFIAESPGWLGIRQPEQIEDIPRIDLGERAAISLVRELNAGLLLIDDLEGRQAARERLITVIGTIGILERAARQGMIVLADVFDRIRRTDFRISDELIEAALERDARRREDKRPD